MPYECDCESCRLLGVHQGNAQNEATLLPEITSDSATTTPRVAMISTPAFSDAALRRQTAVHIPTLRDLARTLGNNEFRGTDDASYNLRHIRNRIIQALRSARRSLREPSPIAEYRVTVVRNERNFAGYANTPRRALELAQAEHDARRLGQVWRNTYPADQHEHVGLELEFIAESKTAIGQALVDSPYVARFDIVSDSSIETYDEAIIDDWNQWYGGELRICCKPSELADVLNDVLPRLENIGAFVNTSCGLHVHLDCRERNASYVSSRLIAAQRLLMSLQPRDRWDNEFCHPNGTCEGAGRYLVVNSSAMDRHGTIEVRCGAATLDIDRILGWVATLRSIADARRATGTRELAELSRLFDWDDATAGYVATQLVNASRDRGESATPFITAATQLVW